MIEAVKAAREMAVIPITTPFGELRGQSAADVTRLIVDTFDYMRFVDVRGTLSALMAIYQEEHDEQVRKQILKTVKRLAEYDLSVWRSIGPAVQRELLIYLGEQPAEDLDAVFAIPLTIWREVLGSDVTGTTWKADSVIISTGTVQVDNALKEIRSRAIHALFDAFDRALTDARREEILRALNVATHVPSRTQCSNELLAQMLSDAKRIVDFVTTRAAGFSYELNQDLEYRFHMDYKRTFRLTLDDSDPLSCKDHATALTDAILTFRDTINGDERFVRYKVLVGFKSIFPGHWEHENCGYEGAEEYRKQQTDSYIAEITPETQTEWLQFAERCAATRSNDLATFPTFVNFLLNLARVKPEVAEFFAINGHDDLLGFLAALLSGLFESGNRAIYDRVLDRELAMGAHLWALVRHWRSSIPTAPDKLIQIFALAAKKDDLATIAECLISSLEHANTERVPPLDELYRPAIRHLTERADAKWINMAWFLPTIAPAFDAMLSQDAALLLTNMLAVREIEYHEEKILEYVAVRHLRAVWEFFGERLRLEDTKQEDGRYEAVPFSFQGLEKQFVDFREELTRKARNFH